MKWKHDGGDWMLGNQNVESSRPGGMVAWTVGPLRFEAYWWRDGREGRRTFKGKNPDRSQESAKRYVERMLKE
jgi:hypothetical protein